MQELKLCRCFLIHHLRALHGISILRQQNVSPVGNVLEAVILPPEETEGITNGNGNIGAIGGIGSIACQLLIFEYCDIDCFTGSDVEGAVQVQYITAGILSCSCYKSKKIQEKDSDLTPQRASFSLPFFFFG